MARAMLRIAIGSERVAPRRALAVAGLSGCALVVALLITAEVLPQPFGAFATGALGGAVIASIVAAFGARHRLSLHSQRLECAIDNMNQGLCMFDNKGRLVVWNRRYVDMYRIDPRRIRHGVSLHELLDARVAAGTFPFDVENYATKLRAAIGQGKAFTLNVEQIDGRTIAVVNQPMADGGWVATHEDITERTHAERALEQTRQFLDTIIENVPTPIIVKDAELRYCLINRAAEQYLGVGREVMLGRRARDVLPAETAEVIEAQDTRLIHSGDVAFLDEHAVLTPRNGIRIVTATRLTVKDKDGKPQYLIIVINDLTDRKRSEQRIAHMANHDPLTDLPNRAAFNESLRATVDLAAAAGESFALLCIDLDRFKSVNDVFGHATGDALLREVALRMQSVCHGAFLARLGGDEFAVITPTGPQPAVAEALAERLGAALDADIDINGHVLRADVTIGIAIYPQDGADASTLVSNADAAMFRAKTEARGSIRFFEIAMDKQLRDKRALQQELRLAVARNELALHYQPQATIAGEIVGFDALASWPRPLHIAINRSPVQFLRDDLPKLVHGILLETGLAPGRLELEVTESVLIGDFTRALSILRRLKGLGVRIAMDDFGTGYSSLSYLQAFPFDKIKIDQAFVVNLAHSAQSATIIRAVIALGHGLDLPVMAEGVETEEQLRFLAGCGCDGIQGFFVGRPQPINEYAEAVGRAPFGKKRKRPHIAIAS